MQHHLNPSGAHKSPEGSFVWAPALLCGLGVLVLIVHPASPVEKLFAIAYGLDPQRPSHTYFMGGVQLPLEARKLGMFGGFLIGCLALLATGRWRAAAFPARRIMIVLLGFIALMGLDGANALFFDLGWPYLYAPQLSLRLATGLLTGVAMAGLLVPAANGSLWRDIRLFPSFANGKDVAGALLLCAVFSLIVDARPALLYYPVAFTGIAGLLLEMLLINLIFVLTLTRRLGTAETWRDTILPITAALILIVCELAAMSVVRYVTIGDVTRLM